MITVRYGYSPGGVLSLDLSGHADLVKEGSDPVCAGVSALVYTLAADARAMEEEGLLRRPPHLLLESGNAHLSVLPLGKGRRRAEGSFNLILSGLSLIEDAYPCCVRIEPVRHKRKKLQEEKQE